MKTSSPLHPFLMALTLALMTLPPCLKAQNNTANATSPSTKVPAATTSTNATAIPSGPPVEVSSTNPNILYFGRWDRSHPGVAHGNWSGHYLRTKFTGTSVFVKLQVGTQLAVSIDGDPVKFIKAGPGITLLNEKPLKPGDHLLQLGSAGQNEEVAFQGLVLDPGAGTKPVDPKPIIEFIGDSITTMFVGNNFAWETAGMLGCDQTQISFSGVALTDGYGCFHSKVGLESAYFLLKNYNHIDEKPAIPWDFSYTPAMVVILLGQNDQCGKPPSETFITAYRKLVNGIRAKFPKTPIVLMRTLGGPYEKEILASYQSLHQTDPDVHYVDTTGWLDKEDFKDGVHPNAGGHLKIARKLANEIAPLLKSCPNPSSSPTAPPAPPAR